MATKAHPLVSVVLPVFNGGDYLQAAVESILQQSLRDFECIIIDDGSTDHSLRLLEKLARSDSRIRLSTRSNKGLVATLNEAIATARGTYIARMDADDLSLPDRFKQQVDYLESHPEVVVVGCDLQFIDARGEPLYDSPLLTTDQSIRLELLSRAPFAHSSVMLRRSALPKTPYRTTAWPVEDYDLWLRLSAHGQLANLPHLLHRYRLAESGISLSNVQLQAEKKVVVQEQAWQQLATQHLVTAPSQTLDVYMGTDPQRAARALALYRMVWRQALRRRKMRLWLQLTRGLLTSHLVWDKFRQRVRS